jgi:murein DD-endopeptidase MepM/ murein hydrolase activator NlpD
VGWGGVERLFARLTAFERASMLKGADGTRGERTMKNFLLNYLKRSATLMVVPREGGKPFYMKARLVFLQSVLLAFSAVVVWALWVTALDRYDAQTLAQSRRFNERMKELEREMLSNGDKLDRMAKLENQMRQALRLKNPRHLAAYAGIGGPTDEDSEQLSKLLEEKDEKTLSKLSAGVDSQTRETIRREASFREIGIQMDRQRSIQSAKPSLWPVKGWITSGYGKRMSPLTGEPGRHMGVDIANETNTPIRATADGLVTYAGWQAGYGRLVVVEHGYGYSTRYGHCARVRVKVGEEVKRGQVLAYIGSTGHSTGSHCHYEVRLHGLPVDPGKYLPSLD